MFKLFLGERERVDQLWKVLFLGARMGRLGDSRTYEIVGLPYLIGRLFQPSLRGVDPSIALVDVFLHVTHVIVLEAIFCFIRRALVFSFEGLTVDFGAGTEVLFCVREEVVRAGAGEKRTADFRVCE